MLLKCELEWVLERWPARWLVSDLCIHEIQTGTDSSNARSAEWRRFVELIQPHVHILSLKADQWKEVSLLQKESPKVSFADAACLFHARNKLARLFTDDRKLQTKADSLRIEIGHSLDVLRFVSHQPDVTSEAFYNLCYRFQQHFPSLHKEKIETGKEQGRID